MAKLGYLYLQDGVWDGARLLSSAWIDRSTQLYTRFESGGGYGYQWWSLPATIDNTLVRIPYALGWGDQYVFVIAPLNIVIVSTAEYYSGQQSHMGDILFDYIFPAVAGHTLAKVTATFPPMEH